MNSVGVRPMPRVMYRFLLLFLVPLFFLSGCGSEGQKFDEVGQWKVVNDVSVGILSKGSIVSFDGRKTAIFSPSDTYVFHEEGGQTYLDLTGALGGNMRFLVTRIDNDHLSLKSAERTVELVRLS